MAFSASFTIKAIDQFSAISKTVAKNARAMKKAIDQLSDASVKTSQIQKSMAQSLRQNAQDFEHARKAAARYKSEINTIRPAKTGMRMPAGVQGGGAGAALGGLTGNIASAAGAYLGVSGAQAAVSNFMAVEDALADVAAITGQTGDSLKKIEVAAFDLGKTFGKSGAEILDVFKIVGSKRSELLKDPAALKEFTRLSMQLSAAGGIDAATSAETLSKSIDAMGKGAGDAQRFADIIATGTRVGSVEVNEMSDALRNIGGVAAEAGIDFEQVNAGLQALGKIRTGAMAGTSFAGILQKMSIAGIDFKRNGLAGGLEQVAAEMGKLKNESEKMEFIKQLVGADFAGEALFLIRNTGLMRDYEQQIRNSSGSLKEMADIRLDTMSTDLGKIKSSLGAEMFKGFQDAAPALQLLMETMLRVFGQEAGGLSSVISGLITLVSLPITGLIRLFEVVGTVLGGQAASFATGIGAISDFATGEKSFSQMTQTLAANRAESSNILSNALDINVKVDQDGRVSGVETKGKGPMKLGGSMQ